MMQAKFVLSKSKLLSQLKLLEDLNLKVSYSYKTNHEVGDVLQENSEADFSIHAKEELEMINDKSRIWFFTQAELENELKDILSSGIRNFVIDNEIDLERLLEVIGKEKIKINLSLRMKFSEHRIGTGKYFVYGMNSKKINLLIEKIKNNSCLEKIGVHIHRKSQNTSEWEIVSELKDSLTDETLERINFLNLGGGLPTIYRGYTTDVLPYIFEKIKITRDFLLEKGIEVYIEPGRFLAAPCVDLHTNIIQKQDKNLIINTTIYNCALDTILTSTKLMVLGEKDSGEFYLVKGNSPTRDDIFRYKVYLENPLVGDKIVFLGAGAYNYTTDFFGYKKIPTEIVN
jgi:ornithine decarboxylase